MLKKILKSQSGLSLVEVMVAASISIIVAVWVMKITENATKSVTKMNADLNIVAFRDTIKKRMNGPARCLNTTIDSADTTTLLGLDITNDVTNIEKFHTHTNPDSNKPEFYNDDASAIVMAPEWKVTAAKIEAFNNAGTGSVVGSCDIVIDLERINSLDGSGSRTGKTIGRSEQTIRIPMTCQVDGSNLITSCSAIIDADEEGYWNAQSDALGEHILFNGLSGGNPRAKIGSGGNFAAVQNSSLILDPLAAQGDGGAPVKMHALAIPSDASLTFGDSKETRLWHGSGVVLNLDGGLDATDDINSGQNITAAQNITATAGDVSAGNDVIAGNDMTAAQNITATNGNITASSGNIIAATGNVEAANTIQNQAGGWIFSPTGISSANNLYAGQDVVAARDVNAGRNVNAGDSVNATTVNATTINASQANVPIVNGVSVIPSDERYKKEISDIDNALEQVMELRGTTYFMRIEEFPDKHFPSQRQYGVIAQELEKVFPNLVYTDPISGYKSVQYANMVAILIEAIKEHRQETLENKKMAQIMREGLQEKNQEQDRRISALEKENKELKGQVEDLKKQVEKLYLLYQKEK